MKNVYLVGFMGTGKTVAGRILARLLGRNFIDLDDLIELSESSTINDIFCDKGESAFRDLETTHLKKISNENNLIVACGGGIVIKQDNIDIMKSTGIIVCLTASPEIIFNRVKLNTARPLLNVDNPPDKIKKLLEIRKSFYEKADFQIDTSGISEEEVANRILDTIKIQ